MTQARSSHLILRKTMAPHPPTPLPIPHRSTLKQIFPHLLDCSTTIRCLSTRYPMVKTFKTRLHIPEVWSLPHLSRVLCPYTRWTRLHSTPKTICPFTTITIRWMRILPQYLLLMADHHPQAPASMRAYIKTLVYTLLGTIVPNTTRTHGIRATGLRPCVSSQMA